MIAWPPRDPTEPRDPSPWLRDLLADAVSLPLIAAGLVLGGSLIAAGALAWRALAPKTRSKGR